MFYNGKSPELNETLLDSYLSTKVKGYMQQDKEAKRLISTYNYITKEWLKRCIGTNCKCGVEFTCDYNRGNITSNLTARRNANNECHKLSNIKPLCIICSTSLSSTYF